MDRLPRGRHGLAADFVARNQRERLIRALVEVLDEMGYKKTTVSEIGKRASVSKSDFYKHFESKDDCFHVAYEEGIARIRGEVKGACVDSDAEWPQRVHDALQALLELFAHEPALANFTLVEGLRAGRGVYDRYQAALDGFAPWLREGAPPPPGDDAAPEEMDLAVVGGVARLLSQRVRAGGAKQLGALLPETLEFTLTPYLGAAEAGRIVSGG